MKPEIKKRDLKKMSQERTLNLLFLLDQKLKKLTKDALAQNQVTVMSSMSSTTFDCFNRFEPERSINPKNGNIDLITKRTRRPATSDIFGRKAFNKLKTFFPLSSSYVLFFRTFRFFWLLAEKTSKLKQKWHFQEMTSFDTYSAANLPPSRILKKKFNFSSKNPSIFPKKNQTSNVLRSLTFSVGFYEKFATTCAENNFTFEQASRCCMIAIGKNRVKITVRNFPFERKVVL